MNPEFQALSVNIAGQFFKSCAFCCRWKLIGGVLAHSLKSLFLSGLKVLAINRVAKNLTAKHLVNLIPIVSLINIRNFYN